MAADGHSGARTCGRCGHTIMPRQGLLPRFCAVCGLRFPPTQATLGRVPGSVNRPATAVWALTLGVLSLIPMCGLPAGLTAMILGASARQRIDNSREPLGGRGMATAGLVLGVIGTALQALFCLGVR